jgi:DNA repair exonuclease SbcCD ATPase subunit
MSDHADSGEYGLHTNWENCEGGPCCDEALAIMEALVAERDEAKAQFWQQRHEWAAATGRNQEIIDGLLAERDNTERTNGPWKCLAETETKLAAAEAERDRLIAERQRLTDENDKGVRALWDEKNKFMEALEVEMVEKKALIAERERLRDEIDADCVRIVAAEAEVARLREALAKCPPDCLANLEAAVAPRDENGLLWTEEDA